MPYFRVSSLGIPTIAVAMSMLPTTHPRSTLLSNSKRLSARLRKEIRVGRLKWTIWGELEPPRSIASANYSVLEMHKLRHIQNSLRNVLSALKLQAVVGQTGSETDWKSSE
jgi:hypothetical protein